MTAFYLTRARLRRDVSPTALVPLLKGKARAPGRSNHSGHHLVGYLLANGADRRRDYLWREVEPGTFYILSERHPHDPHDLFDLGESKCFAPELSAGDWLSFSLRANPLVRRRTPYRAGNVKQDVVMHALRKHPRGVRASYRMEVAREAGFEWLAKQAAKAGFVLEREHVTVDRYERHRIERDGSAPMSFSTLEFEGVLRVAEPEAVLSRIRYGFGGAKAYGCGLMLIRPAMVPIDVGE